MPSGPTLDGHEKPLGQDITEERRGTPSGGFSHLFAQLDPSAELPGLLLLTGGVDGSIDPLDLGRLLDCTSQIGRHESNSVR